MHLSISTLAAWLQRERQGLIRRYLPKGVDLSPFTDEDLSKLKLDSIAGVALVRIMQKSALTLVLAATVLLGACASKGPSPASEPAKPAAAAPDATPRISAPVVVPAMSAKKVVMSMTGTKQVTESKDWAEFKREWRDTFGDHAKAAGIEFTFVEGDVQPQGVDGTVLAVNVADYRMVGIAARIFLGIMTGNAYIDARIRFANLRDGTTLGEQQHNTSSSAWGGVFAKVTPQQVDAIATEVFRDFKAAK